MRSFGGRGTGSAEGFAPIEALAAIPEELSAVEAGPLLCAGITTFNALRHSGARAGDLVAILGIGGLGHLGVQFAHRMGFHTVAIARGQDKKKLALELGAHRYVDSQTEDVAKVLTGLGGAKVILATVTNAKAMTQVLGGLGIGFVPGAPHLELKPEIVLVGFLPPLLYSGAFFTSLRDLRTNARAISLLAVGLVTFPTLIQALIAPVLYFGFTTLEGHFITPSIMGRRLALNPLTVFLALIFWTWLWGPIGAFLAVPLLIVALVAINHLFPQEERVLPG